MKIKEGPFKPTLESLRKFECPEWFKDAKFGIWSHWGPQSVPMFGDWYARNIYIQGTEQYLYHLRRFGHPSKFGYKDIIKLWKAEKFEPEKLMELYVKAGAKYFVAQAVHHDNFDNWNSKYHRWNATNFGPKKDIVSLWHKATKKFNLRFGLSEHLGASFQWWSVNKESDKTGPYAGVPYDGNNPKYSDLYILNNKGAKLESWYTSNIYWHNIWFKRIKDLIDQHKPDLLYSDGGLPFYLPDKKIEFLSPGLNIVAHLYNTSVELYGKNESVYTQKDRNEKIYTIGVLDIERDVQEDIFKTPWQTDTSIGDWFYNLRYPYKTFQQIIEMLVDIISKNGNLLLNVPQKPDGTIDYECEYILKNIAEWIKINGEGVYGTRPWKKAGEGFLKTNTGNFNEPVINWKPEDFRFTAKSNILYAFQMSWPLNKKAFIKSLPGNNVKEVNLLGYNHKLKFKQTSKGLLIYLPDKKPLKMSPHCFKITIR